MQHFGETRNLNGDYSGQVKFSLREYTYEALTAKPDMRVTKVNDSVSYRPTREARKEIVARAIENAKKIGRTNENGNAVVRVADTGDEVILSAKGLRHGLDRRFSVNAPVTLKAGEIIRNAIRINEFTPENAQMDASYALIGAAKNAKNEPYIVQFVVNRYSNEVSSIDVLYAVNAKKEPAALLPDVTSTDVPAILTDSVISIRSLLDYVNRYFPDVLPESVLRHYNHDRRPEGKLGESALYQQRDNTRTERDILTDATDGDAANVRETVTGAACSAIWTEYKSSGCIAWMQPLLLRTSVCADGQGIVVLPLFNGADDDVVADVLIDLYVHGLASTMPHHGLAHGGFLADEPLEHVLPQRRHEADGLLLIVVRNINDHRVEQPHRVAGRAVGDDLRRVDHALQVADAAVVAVFLAFGGLVFKVFAQVAEGARRLDLLDQLRPQLARAVVDLVAHLLDVDLRQFVVHM